MADPSDLIGIGEAARLLGVTPQTIRNWESDGVLVSVRTHGGHRRFSRTAVDAILRTARTGGAA